MPNWVSTQLSITGPKEDIDAFLAKCDRETGIIPSYLPVPEELQITSTSAYEQIPEGWQKMVDEGTWTQEDYDERVAGNNELLAKQKANIAKYGHKDWYEWQYNEWGTKWGDCHTQIGTPYEADGAWSVDITFDTPWGTAHKAWLTISAMFPNLVFLFSYDEEAGFFAGYEIYCAGDSLIEAMYEPSDYPEDDLDWDDDDSVSKYLDWKNDKDAECSDAIAKFVHGIKAYSR